MIRRPLDKRFNAAVLSDRKWTTIRPNPWRVGIWVMLYNWERAPYRSKQVDVTSVRVIAATEIWITHHESGQMSYLYKIPTGGNHELWQSEGFDSQAEMDDWFRRVIRRGQRGMHWLMAFGREQKEAV